jgi:hypothetical protein
MKFLILLSSLFILVSCASENPSLSKINSLEVSEKLVKGQTTQAQVIESFGTPDIVEKTPDGDMWAYNRHANENSSSGAGVSHYIAAAGLWNFTGMNVSGDKSTSSTNTASLVLYFGPSKKLRTYTYRTERF